MNHATVDRLLEVKRVLREAGLSERLPACFSERADSVEALRAEYKALRGAYLRKHSELSAKEFDARIKSFIDELNDGEDVPPTSLPRWYVQAAKEWILDHP